MLAVSCDKCRRRFTLADEELQGYLQQAGGKKHALVLCPHCGKGNKVAYERLARALSGPPGSGSVANPLPAAAPQPADQPDEQTPAA